MNDTILNRRQQKILKILRDFGQISSTDLFKTHGKDLGASKITIIRDLNLLLQKGLITSIGKARSTQYRLTHDISLLRFIDLDAYFDMSFTERNAKKDFQAEIFSQLHSLFTAEEKKHFKTISTEFIKRMELFDQTLFKREFERFVVEFSWKSSQIEGNTYDLLETEALIKMHVEARGHTKKEAAMILNHKSALNNIIEKPTYFQKLTVGKIVELHEILMQDLEISTGVRKRQVRITGTPYIPPIGEKTLKTLLGEIVNVINRTSFPPEKALIAGAMIAYLQPFADGNKRTARIVANAILLAYNYFPLSYRNIEPVEYVKAMILFYEQNNLYHMKRIFVGQMEFGEKNYFII